jgi:hypothetical protein
MKKTILFLGIIFLSLISCSKNGQPGNIDDLYKNAPRSNMPDELSPAEWRYGSISALSLYDRRGNHVANGEEALREYKVTKDGFVEFVQYLAVAGGGCYSMTYTHVKGTMKFEAPNKITWTPVEGEFYKKFTCGGTESTRKADQDDLNRMKSVYWYKLEDLTFSGSKDYIVLYNNPSMESQHQEFAYKLIK